jgi:hypothetical protein
MKTVTVLLTIVVLIGPATIFADTDDDTLQFYLEKSDLVVLGTIVELWGIPFDGVGVVQPWTYELRVAEVLKGDGDLKGKTIKFDIRHFMEDEKDVDPLLKKGNECIVFLRDDGDDGWITADIWFGIHYPSPTMVKSLKRLAAQEALTEESHWKKKTIDAVERLIAEPGREDLAEETKRFLENPAVYVASGSASKSMWLLEENKEALEGIDPADCTIGTLRCGIFGGYSISVVFNTETGKQIAISVIPGE